MGNYIFDTEFLFDELIKDSKSKTSSHDFGKDIIPQLINNAHIQAYPFRDLETGERAYWRDVGTLDSFWLANMEMIATTPQFNIYDPEWPVWTYSEQLPPAKFVFDSDNRRGMALDSMVSGGCIVSGAAVRRSILFSNVTIESYSDIRESVVLPSVKIGANVKIRKAIIDRGVEIPDGTVIGYDHDEDIERGFRVTEKGVVLITRSMLGQKGGYE
jgi:glucose-1-phosphate adenylyltransferase